MPKFWDTILNYEIGMMSPELREQLKGKHKSIPRNPFLADRLYLIKYIERWGRGTDRIVDEMRKGNIPDAGSANHLKKKVIFQIRMGRYFCKTVCHG